jgi:hypothetical protein
MPDKSEHIRGIALELATLLPLDTDDAVTSHRSHETAYQMAARQHHGDATTLCAVARMIASPTSPRCEAWLGAQILG